MALKQCIYCPPGLLKDTSEFHVSRHGKTKDGLKSACKDCAKEKRNAWALKNRGREREWNAAKYAADPKSFKTRASAYRARKRKAFVEHVDRDVVYEMHGGMCGICEDFISGDFHVDHVIPLSKGGLHCYANTQPAHPECNERKHNKVM